MCIFESSRGYWILSEITRIHTAFNNLRFNALSYPSYSIWHIRDIFHVFTRDNPFHISTTIHSLFPYIFLPIWCSQKCWLLRVFGDRRTNPQPMHVFDLFFESLVHHPVLHNSPLAFEFWRFNLDFVHGSTSPGYILNIDERGLFKLLFQHLADRFLPFCQRFLSGAATQTQGDATGQTRDNKTSS